MIQNGLDIDKKLPPREYGKKRKYSLAFRFDKSEYPETFRGHQYAVDVVTEKITACAEIIWACERYLEEVADGFSKNYYFNPDKSEKFLRLSQKFDHVIGKWETKNIRFEPWQCFAWANIMGFISTETGFRRFRVAHLDVARGNGKSAMASVAGLYFLALDEPQGNLVSTVATKKEQARIVFDSSRAMALKNQSFTVKNGVKVLAHTIKQPKTNSEMRPLSSEAKSLDGLNDVLAITDELHAMKRTTFEVITSGMSKRKDSLLLSITTAGSDLDSVGYSQNDYMRRMLRGDFEDESTFAMVFTLDEGDDVFNEKNWIKANPNWDVSVDPKTFKNKVLKAIQVPADLPGVKIKHLNMWLGEAKAFFSIEHWDKCIDTSIKMEDFKTQRCKLGIDIASNIDLTSQVYIFRRAEERPDKWFDENGKPEKRWVYYLFDKTFIPEKPFEKANSDVYKKALARGELIITPGEVLNIQNFKKIILDTADDYHIEDMAFDPWNATDLSQQVDGKKRIQAVKFNMNVANISEPMKMLDTIMRDDRLRHNGSSLLRWCISNVVAKRDHNDNVFPRKTHEKFKIDPAVAAIMSLAAWVVNGEEKISIYETEARSFRTL